LTFISIRLYQNQKFKKYIIPGISIDIIQESAQNLNFKGFDFNEKIGYFSGLTRAFWFSAGESVTILLNEEIVIITSRPVMGPILPQPITIFKDRKNSIKLIQEIKNTTATAVSYVNEE
jgi:hypothetical protein